MSTIRIAMLAAGLLAAAGSVHSQTPQTTPSGAGSSMTAPDANKPDRDASKPAAQGVEGSTGTQGGPKPNEGSPGGPAGATPQSATDPASGRDVDRSVRTEGVPADKGAQGGPAPVQPGEPKAGTTKQ